MKKIVKPVETETATVEVIGDAIVAIAAGMKKLRSGKLNDRALVLLIKDACPAIGAKYRKRYITATEVRTVLAGIESLEASFIKRTSHDPRSGAEGLGVGAGGGE